MQRESRRIQAAGRERTNDRAARGASNQYTNKHDGGYIMNRRTKYEEDRSGLREFAPAYVSNYRKGQQHMRKNRFRVTRHIKCSIIQRLPIKHGGHWKTAWTTNGRSSISCRKMRCERTHETGARRGRPEASSHLCG